LEAFLMYFSQISFSIENTKDMYCVLINFAFLKHNNYGSFYCKI